MFCFMDTLYLIDVIIMLTRESDVKYKLLSLSFHCTLACTKPYYLDVADDSIGFVTLRRFSRPESFSKDYTMKCSV